MCAQSSVWTAWIYMEKIMCSNILHRAGAFTKLPKTISIWFTYAHNVKLVKCLENMCFTTQYIFMNHSLVFKGTRVRHTINMSVRYESRKTWKKVTANSCGGCLNHVTAKKKSFMFVLFACLCVLLLHGVLTIFAPKIEKGMKGFTFGRQTLVWRMLTLKNVRTTTSFATIFLPSFFTMLHNVQRN